MDGLGQIGDILAPVRTPPAQRKAVFPISRQVSETRYCYPETRPGASDAITVAFAGKESCNPDYSVRRDDFPCCALEFVAGGRGELVLDGQRHPLHAGVLFAYGPGVRHEIVNRSTHPLTKYFVDFRGEEAEALLRQSRLAPARAVQTPEVEVMRSLFERLIDEGAGTSPFSRRLCAAYLRVILLKAAEAVQPVLPAEASLAARFHRWRDFIETNCHRLRDLDDVARELGVRPAYLCRVFKQFGQPGPFRFLTQRKMNRAADLLAGTRSSVKAVALDLGYADPGHFSRLFRHHLGCPPALFAQRHGRHRAREGTKHPVSAV